MIGVVEQTRLTGRTGTGAIAIGLDDNITLRQARWPQPAAAAAVI